MFPADSRNFRKKNQISFLQEKSAGLVLKKHKIKRFLEKKFGKVLRSFFEDKKWDLSFQAA